MCGIAGIIVKKDSFKERIPDFIESSKLMQHRGPDFMGVHVDNNIALIHFRLGIIDIDKRSNQPFYSKNKDLVTVYNGEIYNYRELQKAYGINTITGSDTEVMLETFSLLKENAIREWNGIFAMSILDKKSNSFFLIRDRLGIKPLYLYEDENVIAFASEAKVILNWLEKFELNYSGLAQYMWLGNTSGTETIIKNLTKVEPGTSVQICLDTFSKSVSKFWTIEENLHKVNYSENEAVLKLRELLETSVRRQLVSDVSIGVLLSGGIDSSSVVAHASRHINGKLDTYTAFYDYNSSSKEDLLRARKVSKRFNTNHHELEVKSRDIEDIFKKMVVQYDEPFGDAASIPLYQVANLCSKDKRVILQGDGGDELFAGYRKYNVVNSLFFWRYSSLLYHFIPDANWRQRLKRTSAIVNQSSFADLMAYYTSLEDAYQSPYSVFTFNLQNKLTPINWKVDFQKMDNILKGENKVQKMLLTDLRILLPNTYLEKVDKATMFCSVEARVPMLDNELVEFAISLDSKLKVRGNQKKYLLKKALDGIIPDEILYGAKKGFDAPYQQWLRKDLYVFAKEIFLKANDNIINKNHCLRLLDEHKDGIANHGIILWKTLILCYWIEIYEKSSKLVL